MSSFNLSQWWHDLIDHLFKHPQAETVAHPAIAAIATAAQPAPTVIHDSPVVSAPSGFDWSRYSGQTDNVAFMAFAMSGRGNPQDADKAAAYAAGVVKTVTPTPGGDTSGSQNSAGPLASFDKLYDQGRWTFKAGVSVDVPINAPAGSYRIQMSGSGGQAGEGGDSSAHVAVTVKDGGNVIGSGDANATASFTKGDGPVVVTFLSDKDTLQAVTLQTGAAVLPR